MTNQLFLNYLVNLRIFSEEEANAVVEESIKTGKTVEEVIISQGKIDERDLFEHKSAFLKIPLKRVIAGSLTSEVLENIPEEAAKHYSMVALAKEGDVLHVGMLYPEDYASQSALNFISAQKKLKTIVFLITPTDFDEALKRYKALRSEVKEVLEELEKEEELEAKPTLAPAKIEKITEEAPISKVVSVILRHAIEGRASDVHIEPFEDKMRIRYRVDGILYSSLFLDKKLLPSVVSRIKILSSLRIDESRIPQDGRFRVKISGRQIDFRVATFPTAQGEKIALRVLDPEKAIISMDNLGIVGRNYEFLEKASRSPYGMILFCGPTGSGKTTSQYAILRELNNEGVNIVTLEDPVEYWISGVNQSQVRPDIGYDFASGIREVVRQDPDIVMVGEIRDQETASLATHAALTGHLVLSTLHTNDSIGTIPRLIDLGVEKFLIPASLRASVSQRLIRKLCPDCKKKVKANPEQETIVRNAIESMPPEEKAKIDLSDGVYLYEAQGCSTCNQKGTKGRIGIFEVLQMTKELEVIILETPSEINIREEAKRQGMITMLQDGVMKALDGLVSLEEVIESVQVGD